MKEFVTASLMSHYGFEQDESGEWVSGPEAREIPKVLDSLRIKRKDYFHRLFIGGDAAAAGERNHVFFDKAQDSKKPYDSNFREATLPGNKFFIAYGIQLESAVGAAAGTDAMSALDFGTVTENEILNGLIKFSVNNMDEISNDPIKSKFLNSDPVPNFLRLPRPIVWEPDEVLRVELDLAAAFLATIYVYANITLMGVLLEK